MEETQFTWRRGHLFEFVVALALYEHVLSDTIAQVVKVVQKPTKKWFVLTFSAFEYLLTRLIHRKPLPLTTVELQKSGSRLLKLAPKKLLDVSPLHLRSEPEITCFQDRGEVVPTRVPVLPSHGNRPVRSPVRPHVSYPQANCRPELGRVCYRVSFTLLLLLGPSIDAPSSLEQADGFTTPRQGKNNDKAHPPIHPTAHAANLAGDEKRVYEFITRRYLACCSKDAEGWEKTVEVEYGGERFSASGMFNCFLFPLSKALYVRSQV